METLIRNQALDEIATSGYHLALRVGFAFPEFERNSLPAEWVATYTRSGLMIFDPVVRWIYDNSGFIRWSEISYNDERNVLKTAGSFGLHFGAAVSVMDEEKPGLRSFGNFARSDREFEDDELAALKEAVLHFHRKLQPARALTSAELDVLRLLASGLMLKEIAFELGISESAVKLRLTNARNKLDARTNTQAVGLTKQYGWI